MAKRFVDISMGLEGSYIENCEIQAIRRNWVATNLKCKNNTLYI